LEAALAFLIGILHANQQMPAKSGISADLPATWNPHSIPAPLGVARVLLLPAHFFYQARRKTGAHSNH
jgi:hypothetical protein